MVDHQRPHLCRQRGHDDWRLCPRAPRRGETPRHSMRHWTAGSSAAGYFLQPSSRTACASWAQAWSRPATTTSPSRARRAPLIPTSGRWKRASTSASCAGRHWIEPALRVFYTDMQRDAYTDLSATFVPAGGTTLGRITFGPTIGTTFYSGTTTINPFARINGAWNFENNDDFALSTGAVLSDADLALDLGGGFDVVFKNGVILAAAADWFSFDSRSARGRAHWLNRHARGRPGARQCCAGRTALCRLRRQCTGYLG